MGKLKVLPGEVSSAAGERVYQAASGPLESSEPTTVERLLKELPH